MASAWAHRLISTAGLGLVLLLSMCSSPQADGGDCEDNEDCTSERCRNNRCDGHYCICEGADCRGRSDCDEGWICVQPSSLSGGVLPTAACQRVCTGPGTCPSGDRCEKGVCRAGGEPFPLEWVSFPRTKPCGARVPCPYKVKSPANANVVRYVWTFSEGANSETTVPETTHTFKETGTYNVAITATAADGAEANLTAIETLCLSQGAPCEVGGAQCCSSSCSVKDGCL